MTAAAAMSTPHGRHCEEKRPAQAAMRHSPHRGIDHDRTAESVGDPLRRLVSAFAHQHLRADQVVAPRRHSHGRVDNRLLGGQRNDPHALPLRDGELLEDVLRVQRPLRDKHDHGFRTGYCPSNGGVEDIALRDVAERHPRLDPPHLEFRQQILGAPSIPARVTDEHATAAWFVHDIPCLLQGARYGFFSYLERRYRRLVRSMGLCRAPGAPSPEPRPRPVAAAV